MLLCFHGMCLILEPVIANGDLFFLELSDDPAESNLTDLSPLVFFSSYNQLSIFYGI